MALGNVSLHRPRYARDGGANTPRLAGVLLMCGVILFASCLGPVALPPACAGDGHTLSALRPADGGWPARATHWHWKGPAFWKPSLPNCFGVS